MHQSELLQYALEHGMINMSYVQEQMEMNKRKEILDRHPYAIWKGKDGKFHTYLPDEKKGRVPRRRDSREELEDLIILHYTEKAKNENAKKTFDECYWIWRLSQDQCVGSPNTPVKYDSDYKRYFKNKDFSAKYIDDITVEDVSVFIIQSIKTQRLCKEAAKTLFGYIRRVFRSALINKIISENPMSLLEAKEFYKHCTASKRSQRDQVLSDNEISMLNKKCEEDLQDDPFYIPVLAVEFASLTAMRVGEVSALMWEDIGMNEIWIHRSEKFNRKTKEYFIDSTKNKKDRKFPMTPEIQQLLRRIRKIELQAGWFCEWVFSDENGRVHAPVISSCMKNKCRQLKLPDHGIHAWRKTVNSKMRTNGVSSVVAASLLGHSVQVNEKYYTFDVSTFDEKQKIIEDVNKKMKAI